MPLWLVPAFFVVAILYSSVGFGGGSSYLALMVIAGLPHRDVPALALSCNLLVAGQGLYHFARAGHLRPARVLPFAILSAPMAYLGGQVAVSRRVYCALLGFSLLAVAIRLWIRPANESRPASVGPSRAWGVGLPSGAALGFLSGVVGIGGGVFLTPLLFLLGWASAKEAAAAASLFIVINSAAGLAGRLSAHEMFTVDVWPLAAAVLVGGFCGSRLGAFRLPRWVVAQGINAVVFYASLRLIQEAL